MSTTTEFDIEKLDKRGGGVFSNRGGYVDKGETLELPSVSGSRERERQDIPPEDKVLHIVTRDMDGIVSRGVRGTNTAGKDPDAKYVEEPVDNEAPKAPIAVQPGAPETHLESPQTLVSIQHKESGFSLSFPAALVVESPPLGGVTTLAVGVQGSWASLTIPKGAYEVAVYPDPSDNAVGFNYHAHFGNQCFQSDLKYIIFVVLSD